MAHSDERTAREKFVDGLTTVLQRHKKLLAAFLAIAAIAIVAVVVFLEVQDRRLDESLTEVDQAQQLLDRRETIQDEAERDRTDEEILSILSGVIESYPRLYSAQRALFLEGVLRMEREEWTEAAHAFTRLADRFSDSHLALLARANEATALEELGDFEGAIEAYRKLYDLRGERNPLRARALFSIGRLYEQTSETATARDFYQRVVQEYSNSSWTSIARNRILSLSTVAP